MKKKILLIIAVSIFIIACNDDFLERYPLDEVSMETYWKTEDDLKTWVNTLYDMTSNPGKYGIQTPGKVTSNILMGNGVNRPWDAASIQQRFKELYSDNLASTHNRTKDYVTIKAGTNTVPTSGWDYTNIGGWWWFLLRPINIFMENYEKAEIPDEIKNHYAGQVRMWRAWFYYDKVSYFGDVPLILKSLDITDTLALYGPRTPREEVMDQVLEDINFACENMPDNWNNGSPGYMNRWAALALKSRICLFEGTWRKYHGGSDPDMWLNEAADAAKEIIDDGGFSLYSTGNPNTDYRFSHWQSELAGNPEIIYWKRYIDGVNPTGAITWWVAQQGGASRSAVEDYLCTDGLPVNQSPLYQGDESIESVFVNRDPRLRQTILHPEDVGPDKPLHFNKGDTQAYPRLPGMSGGQTSETGYLIIKNYNDYGRMNYEHDETAAIIFGYNEVLLNYAEAKAELGQADQTVLDLTINKLRDRVKMPHMEIGNIVDDPRHDDMNVSDLLVEIRRERRVELFADGYRYDDLRRWKLLVQEGSKIGSHQGLFWDDAAAARYSGATIKTSTDPESGKTYVDVFKGTEFDPIRLEEKHYLWPIPAYVLTDNPNLGQNPGW